MGFNWKGRKGPNGDSGQDRKEALWAGHEMADQSKWAGHIRPIVGCPGRPHLRGLSKYPKKIIFVIIFSVNQKIENLI